MWMEDKKKKSGDISEKYTVAAGHVGSVLTITDGSDDTEDKEPQEHISSVAQQQDKEQTDHHGNHQTTARTQSLDLKHGV